MQQQLKQGPSRRAQWLRQRPAIPTPLLIAGIAMLLASMLGGGIWLLQLNWLPSVTATNGADRWANDTSATPARIPFATPGTAQITVDKAFASYYRAHDGAALLGEPLTPAFPVAQGRMQLFTGNALLLPGKGGAATGKANRQITDLMQRGVKDSRTGVITLPLLQTLLTAGSQASVGGGLTYIDLRSATNPNLMLSMPASSSPGTQRRDNGQGAFIPTGKSDGKLVGHFIPPAIWTFINRRDVSPDGWQTNFGAPLTEAIPTTEVEYGFSHRLLIQAFQQRAVVMDRDVKDAKGQPLIQPLDTGVAYLQTFMPPTPALARQQKTMWASDELDILNAPDTGKAILHVGQNFPLTLTGSRWAGGILWYQARWDVDNTSGSGWVPATSITTFAPRTTTVTWSPGSGVSVTIPDESTNWASFQKLSPGLMQYLNSHSATTSAVVYDLTHQRYYGYHLTGQYLMGNAVRLPIVVAFLLMKEQQGIRPTSEEMNQLSAMLTTVNDRAEDDDNAEDMYNAMGRTIGFHQFLDQIGIGSMTPENDDVLYTLSSPLAMTQLLAMLHEGKILTQPDRDFVLSLLKNTASNYQIGVGDTSPANSTALVQDGWVVGTDGRWTMNSSGIVTTAGDTYLISIFSAHLTTLGEGQDIARQVSTAVASLLGKTD